jgi:hypothetical protein
MSVKAAATHIDWTKLTTSLGLKTETVAALSAFRKRNEEARRVLTDLKEQKTAVDFAHYRKVLKNQAVVDELEKSFKTFRAASYDVQAQIKSIEAVEAKAVMSIPTRTHITLSPPHPPLRPIVLHLSHLYSGYIRSRFNTIQGGICLSLNEHDCDPLTPHPTCSR